MTEFQKKLRNFDNLIDPIWGSFLEATRDLSLTLDRSVDDIPAHLGEVWEASVRFASFLLRDKALRKAGSMDPAPLPDDIHDQFDDLVGSVAPWIRRFPGARELDDARGAFLSRPELFEPSVRVIQSAIETDLLTNNAARVLRSSIQTARRDDAAQASKAGTFAMAGARGLITRGASYAAGILAGEEGADLSSPLLRRIGRFLANVETDGTELIADMPRDIRHSLQRMFENAQEPMFVHTAARSVLEPPAQATSNGGYLPKPPDDFSLGDAKTMVLRGEVVPPDWRPFITVLDFTPKGLRTRTIPISDLRSLAPLTALQRLDLAGEEVVDIKPLAGLQSLQSLNLRGTRVTDIEPLANLKKLQRLYLTGTGITDLSPLRGLTALQHLYLSGTGVSDLTPLAGLTALEHLYLTRTQISDITPLASLRALTALNLGNTLVRDVEALANLTALRSLSLWGTLVSDIAPLANLTLLQNLDLTVTPVSDVSPLSGLIALEGLDLTGTKVFDVAPLRHLTRLTIIPEPDPGDENIGPASVSSKGLTNTLWGRRPR